jgi:hypothetical protein
MARAKPSYTSRKSRKTPSSRKRRRSTSRPLFRLSMAPTVRENISQRSRTRSPGDSLETAALTQFDSRSANKVESFGIDERMIDQLLESNVLDTSLFREAQVKNLLISSRQYRWDEHSKTKNMRVALTRMINDYAKLVIEIFNEHLTVPMPRRDDMETDPFLGKLRATMKRWEFYGVSEVTSTQIENSSVYLRINLLAQFMGSVLCHFRYWFHYSSLQEMAGCQGLTAGVVLGSLLKEKGCIDSLPSIFDIFLILQANFLLKASKWIAENSRKSGRRREPFKACENLLTVLEMPKWSKWSELRQKLAESKKLFDV